MKNIGLVLVQSNLPVVHEPLMSGISHGLEETFVRSGMSLVTRVVHSRPEEFDVYRHWCESSAVEAVVLVRVAHADDRIDFLRDLGMPFVAIVDVSEVGDFSAVTIDSATMMRSVLAYLTSHGHTDIVYVRSDEDTVVSDIRARTFLEEAAASHHRGRVFTAPLTADGASTAARSVIAEGGETRKAIILDDDVTAAAALETIKTAGVAVPDRIAVLAWNDSVRCQSASPSITALSDEAHHIGALAAACLITSVASGVVTIVAAADSFIVQRASA